MSAIVRYRVIYHSEISGKFDPHFGHRTALVSASNVTQGGEDRPSPSNIATVLSNNNLHNAKSGALTVIDNIADLDERAVAVYS